MRVSSGLGLGRRARAKRISYTLLGVAVVVVGGGVVGVVVGGGGGGGGAVAGDVVGGRKQFPSVVAQRRHCTNDFRGWAFLALSP